MQLDSFVVEEQEKAGSLANFCPSSYRCREFLDEVKNKAKRKRVEEDVESGEVISVCESEEWEKNLYCAVLPIVVLVNPFRVLPMSLYS